MKRYLVLLIIFITVSKVGTAQQLATQDLLSVQLPPLDTLFEGAKKSSMVEFYKLRMEGQELALKTERRRWLEYFTLYGTYQYGVIGINSYTNLGANFAVVYQNSGGEQLWYNVGGSLTIPLDKVFDRRNRIKTQQLKIKETLKERDLWYDQQKVLIIELYTKAQSMLNVLKVALEQTTLADAQYAIAEKDYIAGALNSQGLNSAKGSQSQAYMQLENIKSELNIAILKLEILSSTKIINK